MYFLLITDTDRLLFNIFYSLFVLAIIVSFIYRNTPLGFLWNLFKWICIGLLISFGIDFIKDKMKDWWSK
jgi:flagellar biosynthesis protein FliR